MPNHVEIATPIPIVWEPLPGSADADTSTDAPVVLAVEPNAKRRQVMRDALEVLGYSVLEATSAIQAHTVLGHLSAPPDLVVAGPDVVAELADEARLPGLMVFSCKRPFTRHQLARRLAAVLAAPSYPTRRPSKNSRSIPPHSDSRTPPSTSAR